ncbi:hypothetical protein L3Q82_020857 [Scortum barcoo]|uniref:Uncharacterized protein n=1 Tax=Scortum barcoo TaxID=214431 RepID=A0ACB8V8T0_9TELE|nr:hypothetical protein L3Q82_020857 [Scortum barcoo]
MSLSWLAGNASGIPPEELEEVSGVREVWASLLRLLPPRNPVPDQADENGWMDIRQVLYQHQHIPSCPELLENLSDWHQQVQQRSASYVDVEAAAGCVEVEAAAGCVNVEVATSSVEAEKAAGWVEEAEGRPGIDTGFRRDDPWQVEEEEEVLMEQEGQ